jgi:hypothetical protein
MQRYHRRLSYPQKWVIALGVLVLILALANLGRAAMALRYATLLPAVPMTVSWTYLAAMGVVWGLIFAACTVELVSFRPWGRWGTLAAVTLYEIHMWANHILFDANEYAFQIRPRDLLLTLLLLALVWGLLNWPSIRKEFKR